MRTTVYKLLATALVSILFIAGIFLRTKQQSTRKNNFIRFFPPHALKYIRTIELEDPYLYFAGCRGDKVFLASHKFPHRLICASSHSDSLQYINLKVPSNLKLAWNAINVTVDSANVYLLEGYGPSYLIGKLTGDTIIIPKKRIIKFMAAAPLSEHSTISTIHRKAEGTLLVKTFFTDDSVLQKAVPLDTAREGIIASDGLLSYNYNCQRLLYTYYYKNRFIVLDTNANILLISRTIDSNFHAKVQTETIASDNVTTFTAPPVKINDRTWITAGSIYIQSMLRANNESEKNFSNASVVDIYDTRDGSYHFSIYIPLQKNIKMDDFRVAGDKLYTLNGKYLSVYFLNLPKPK